MIITATESDYEILKGKLLTLIKENECDISNASGTAINAGLQTFTKPFSVHKLLLQRAIKAIRNQASLEYHERKAYEWEAQNAMEEVLAINEIDSIGPDLLRSECDDLPF